jgi:hypothetical protein
MICAYLFTILALISLPSALKTGQLIIIIAWAAARSPLAGGPLLPLALKWRSQSRLARRIRGVLATLKLEPHLGREHAMAADAAPSPLGGGHLDHLALIWRLFLALLSDSLAVWTPSSSTINFGTWKDVRSWWRVCAFSAW